MDGATFDRIVSAVGIQSKLKWDDSKGKIKGEVEYSKVSLRAGKVWLESSQGDCQWSSSRAPNRIDA